MWGEKQNLEIGTQLDPWMWPPRCHANYTEQNTQETKPSVPPSAVLSCSYRHNPSSYGTTAGWSYSASSSCIGFLPSKPASAVPSPCNCKWGASELYIAITLMDHARIPLTLCCRLSARTTQTAAYSLCSHQRTSVDVCRPPATSCVNMRRRPVVGSSTSLPRADFDACVVKHV